MRRAALAAATAAVALTLSAPVPAAQVTVGTGASVDLGTGSLDLGCADLTVGGTLSAGTAGFSQARDVTIDPSGLVNGDSATLEVTGDWSNSGTFSAGTSSVNFVDGCSRTMAEIDGSTTFFDLAITTQTGKQYQLEAGATQTMQFITLTGGGIDDRVLIRSTVGGVKAFLDLQGSHKTRFVDVDDVGAVGNQITLPFPPNSLIGPNSTGMGFLAIPTLSAWGVVALGLLLLSAMAWVVYRRSGPTESSIA